MMREKIFKIIEVKNDDCSYVGKCYDYVMIMAIVVGLIPLMFKDQSALTNILDITSCVLFIIDYLMRWLTADFRNPKLKKWWFLFYPVTPLAIIDLLSILPTVVLLSPTFKVLRIIRLLMFFRFFKFIRYYEPLQIILRVLKKEKEILFVVLVFAISYIFITALIMFNVEAFDTENGQMTFNNFFEALYWATCTLTTVGYGDFYPVSNMGRVFCMISSLVGIAIIALPSGVITSAYMNEVKQKKGK